MNKVRFLIIFALVSFHANSGQSGRTTFGETRIFLNGFWQFKTDPIQNGYQQKWYAAGLKDAGWGKMEVPRKPGDD